MRVHYIHILLFVLACSSFQLSLEPYSWCKAALLADFGLGTNSQLMDVDTSNPTRIGWRTATPAAAEITPVTMGKMDAPI